MGGNEKRENGRREKKRGRWNEHGGGETERERETGKWNGHG